MTYAWRSIVDFLTRFLVPALVMVALIESMLIINKFDSKDVEITYGVKAVKAGSTNPIDPTSEVYPYYEAAEADRHTVNMYSECQHGHTSIYVEGHEKNFVKYLVSQRQWIIASIALLGTFHFLVLLVAAIFPSQIEDKSSDKATRDEANRKYFMWEVGLGIFGLATIICSVSALCWFLAAVGTRDDCGLTEVNTNRAGYTSYLTGGDPVHQELSTKKQWSGADIADFAVPNDEVTEADAKVMCTRMITRITNTQATATDADEVDRVDGDFKLDVEATDGATSVSASRMAAFLLNCHNTLTEAEFAGGGDTKHNWVEEAKDLEDAAKYIKHHTQAVVLLTALSVFLLMFHIVGNRTVIRDKANGWFRVVIGTAIGQISSVLITNAWVLMFIGGIILSVSSRDRKDHTHLAYTGCAFRWSDDIVSSDRSEEKMYDAFYVGGAIMGFVSFVLGVFVIFLFRNTISTTIAGNDRVKTGTVSDWGNYINSIIHMSPKNMIFSMFIGMVFTLSIWMVLQPLAKTSNDFCPQVPDAHVEQHVTGYLVVVIGIGVLLILSLFYASFGFAGLVRAGILPKYWANVPNSAFQSVGSEEEFRMYAYKGVRGPAFNKKFVQLLEASHA